MVVRLVVAGHKNCEKFAQACLVADYLCHQLPDLCYDRIEKPLVQWKAWLVTINTKNKWNHASSPLIWKELLLKGSKPYYIGDATDFWEYCYSYYNLETYLSPEKLECLNQIIDQVNIKHNNEVKSIKNINIKEELGLIHKEFSVCISGAGILPMFTTHIISRLLDLNSERCNISNVFLSDEDCCQSVLEELQEDCRYVNTGSCREVVKCVSKLGTALNNSDLLVILDHAPFNSDEPIGFWLYENKEIMSKLSYIINLAAPYTMKILFPNLGPACYNATVLARDLVNIDKRNVVVATSDLGLEVASTVAEMAHVPLRNMFCPPVWGFVGINHFVDVYNTVHKYNTFEPYERFVKIKDSTLTLGILTPKMRTMAYLMYQDETLWNVIAKRKESENDKIDKINKSIALVDIIRLWLIDTKSDHITSLGIYCDGSFGLGFDGIFSQPAKVVEGVWRPFSEYLTPADPQMKLSYMAQMAKVTLTYEETDLPELKFTDLSRSKRYRSEDQGHSKLEVRFI